ncbi:MAG: glycosyltransferase, partial [Planctomycetaceae bacterium]|nr:glycosyltransferase [Planctomycetaceae bacterium]
YCKWLCEEGLKQYHIPKKAKAAEQIQEAFEQNPAANIRQLYLSFRPDLRAAFPTALLPTGQRTFLHWLLTYGRAEFAFPEEKVYWFLMESAEVPAREFEITYQTSQQWQQWFPAGLTRFGRDALLDWAKTRHRLSDEVIEQIRERTDSTTMDDVRVAYWSQPQWRKRFPQAFKTRQGTNDLVAWLHTQFEDLPTFPTLAATASENQQLGLNVLGHFCYPSGLQQSVKSIVRSLHEVNVPVQRRDVPAHYKVDGSDHAEYLDFETYDVTLIHAQPHPNVEMPYEDVSYNQAGLEPRADVYRIGYWYWELEDVPSTWKAAAESVDELWAPTKFIADAMRKDLSIKITPMTPGMELGEVEKVDRESFGVGKDEFMFLYMFDVKSFLMRKNPMAVIEAFKRAFRKDDRVKLVIKVSSGDRDPKGFGLLKKKAEEVDAIIIDKVLSRGKSYGLIDACDCYTSLHRSEGLGLTMAEAMMMSKPVIGTRYSGNVDFMSDSTSLLVDYELVPCQHYVHNNYQDHKWADPSVDHSAECMRWVYKNQEEGKAMGERG